jgi:hypothetical protein
LKKYFFLFLINFSVIYAQNSLHTPENILKFANHIYKLGYFDKAQAEFERLKLSPLFSDTIQFYIDLCKIELGDTNFVGNTTSLPYLQYASNKKKFELEKPLDIPVVSDGPHLQKLSLNFLKLKMLSDIKHGRFDEVDKNSIYLFGEKGTNFLLQNLELRLDPPYRSPFLAGLLSTVFPGLGRVYTGEYGDAFSSLLLSGIFGFLGYSNFKDGYTTRGVIFSSLATFFYGGNIYGSVVSADLYNKDQKERVDKEFWEYYYSDKPLKSANKIWENE